MKRYLVAVAGLGVVGCLASPLITSIFDFALGTTLGAFGVYWVQLMLRRSKQPPAERWAVWEHELPAGASATQMREAIGPPFGLAFEDDTEDDDEVTATPKGEYL